MTKTEITLRPLPMIRKSALFLLICWNLNLQASAQKKADFDLIITHAKVFNSRTGTLSSNQTILVKDGIIAKVTGNRKKYSAEKTIDAAGKLVTPGFVDTHIHPTDVYRSYGPLPEYFPKDSLLVYRKRLSDTYLPYGVTITMIMGQPEKWLPPILSWQADPRPYYADIYTVGGALISDEGRRPYINHVIVNSPSAAKQKVKEYQKLGLKHIKLYWKLRRPEFEAAIETADSLGMNVYAHVDQNVMFIDSTLDVGLRNYEHILTLVNSVLDSKKDGNDFNLEMQKYYASLAVNSPLLKFVERLEMFRFIRSKKPEAMNSLIEKLAENRATYSTGIHLMAEQFGLTYFTTSKMENPLSIEQQARCKENFAILMRYAKQLSDKRVKLRIGTDWPSGGKALISEQLLLSEYGFTVPGILQISTINGATALGLDNKYGSIEKGKQADILIWDKSPFDDYRNFLSAKTIIKDGVVYPDPKNDR